MKSNPKITFEDWLKDKNLPESHFDRDIQDPRRQISVQRLFLEKKREYINKDTFKKIRNAQKTSYGKVRDSLRKAQLENIESQKSNSDFLRVRLKNLKNRIIEIENNFPQIIENVYAGHDYSFFIWGSVHEIINETVIDKHFRFSNFVKDAIQTLGEPNPNHVEEVTLFKEFENRLKCAEILDLNIEININTQQTTLLSNLLNDTNKTSPHVSDRRGDNMKEKTLMPEDKFWKKAHELWKNNPDWCLSPNGTPSSNIIENLLRLNFSGYKVVDKQNEETVRLTKSTIRRRLIDFPDKWQK